MKNHKYPEMAGVALLCLKKDVHTTDTHSEVCHEQQKSRFQIMADILSAYPGISSVIQRHRLLLALERLGSVTTYEASRHLDLYDPRARKKELRKYGIDIKTVPVQVTTESGEVHRIGCYVLKGFTQEGAA